jgi:hypothetical protein
MHIIDARVLDHKLLFCASMDLLARTEPFSKFEAGRLIRSVQTQMSNNTCLFIIEGERLTGYLGWLVTSNEVVGSWRSSNTGLRPAEPAEAIVVTIMAVDRPQDILALIKKAKTVSNGLPVYWKRYGETGVEVRVRSVP